MYTEFFGLNEKPFSITPDPRYLYLSRRHADALAHLVYGISESGGFIQLTGEVGTGKTTLIRTLLEQLPERAEIALILNPQLSVKEFLQSICDELGTPKPEDDSVRAIVARLNAHLLKAHSEGRRIVLIVDEAQTLGPELLEQVRLLTNLETPTEKLLQIILIGQPELREVLQRPEMRQIAQRVTGRYHLEPLGRAETEAYVKHRLRVAGCQMPIFTAGAVSELFGRSGGIPRLINVVADRALLAAYARDRTRVDRRLVRQAAAEVFGRRAAAAFWRFGLGAALGVAIVLAGAGVVHLTDRRTEASEPSVGALAERTAAGLPERPRETRVAAALPAETPAAPAPAAPAPSLADLLAQQDTSSTAALRQLFTLWGASYDAYRGAPCMQAVEQSLRCMSDQRGSISELRTMNRPAILTLRDEAGRQHDVVLARLRDESAVLMLGGRSFDVDIAELIRDWYGAHLLLWRPPLPGTRALRPGTRSAEVAWLRRSLARIRGETLDAEPSTLYDGGLEAEVRQYQRERRLDVDGIVGAKTQIAITTDLGAGDAPTLLED
ncbi:MAG TPA: AAA family ATPase [Gammaproteobacteria bacterium]|nr:AAA family ATPase [Gammaproteobacteria bacterium]